MPKSRRRRKRKPDEEPAARREPENRGFAGESEDALTEPLKNDIVPTFSPSWSLSPVTDLSAYIGGGLKFPKPDDKNPAASQPLPRGRRPTLRSVSRGGRLFRSLAILPLLFAIGCKMYVSEPVGSSSGILRQTEAPANTVGIEIFMIRVTPQQQASVRQLWLEVDEQVISPMLRHELREQGFRAGIQGAYLSAALSQLINITGTPSEVMKTNSEGMNEVSVAELPSDPGVSRHFRNLLPGMSAAVPPFEDTVAEMSLFWHENGRVCGKTYRDARGLIRLSAKAQPGGSVRFEIVPELEFGAPETKIRVQSAITFYESGKPRRIFEPLTLSLDLLPGQWIILGPSSPDCGGIGRGFFTRGSEKNEQKLLAIRLAHVQGDSPEKQADTSPSTIPERN